jgi:hypothetical protein
MLITTHGASLYDSHLIADLATIVRIVSHEAFSPADIFLIYRMLHCSSDFHHNGFVHLVADNYACAYFPMSPTL